MKITHHKLEKTSEEGIYSAKVHKVSEIFDANQHELFACSDDKSPLVEILVAIVSDYGELPSDTISCRHISSFKKGRADLGFGDFNLHAFIIGRKKLVSLNDFNEEKRGLYENLNPKQPVYNGIACPNCGYELVDSDPNTKLLSYPPQKNVKCPSCGYAGYRVC